VFAPTGAPTSDYYGGDRKGSNLYANSIVALDAATGGLKWYRQLVHHDIWDYDVPAALVDVKRDGRTIPAVGSTKMALVFTSTASPESPSSPSKNVRRRAGAGKRRGRRNHFP
jgi:quinoprotein glucose dehydrogenase